MLRHRTSIALTLALIMFVAAACQPGPSIVGKWSGAFEGSAVTMEFTDKGELTVTASGQSVKCTYTVDLSTKPAKLDITSESLGKIETIVELVDAKTLRMENNTAGQPRPTTFSDKVVLFTKQ